MATFMVNTLDIIKAREVFTNLFGRHANQIAINDGIMKIMYHHKDQLMIDFINNETQIEYEPDKYWEVSCFSHKMERQYTYTKETPYTGTVDPDAVDPNAVDPNAVDFEQQVYHKIRWANVNRYIPSTWPSDLTEEERYVMEQECKRKI